MIPAALTALVRDHDVARRRTSRRCASAAPAPTRCRSSSTEFSAARRVPDRRGLRHDRGRAGHAQPAVAARSSRARSGRRSAASASACATTRAAAVRARHRRPRLDQDRAARHRGYWETPRRPPRSSATAGSTPATSRAPTTTATSGSSAARSRSSCTTARTSARSRSRARSPSTPAVALVGVVGIHDEVHGENVRAYVTIAGRRRAPDQPGADRLRRERVGYKAPEEVVFLDEMPLNPTGKLDRVGLKRMAEEHLHPHGLE